MTDDLLSTFLHKDLAGFDSIEAFEAALAQHAKPPLDPLALNRLYRRVVPRWHFAMLNDGDRTRAFQAALRAQISPGQLVLDIGAGSGLLAMMAVQAGARAAVSCEMIEPIAHVARRIVAENGLADRITIVPKSSFALGVGADLPARADVLVTETIDCGLLDEGILPIIRHAREHLLAHGARQIPASARVRFALLESWAIHRNNFAFETGGLNISLFNRFSTREYFPVRLATWSHRLLSAPALAFEFDFQGELPTARTASVPVSLPRGGTVHGVVFWFELELGGGVQLSNGPDNTASHWMQAVQCFEVPIPLPRGAVVVEVSHDETGLWFNVPHRQEKLP
jgi:Ribosomal protein L11 methyltransferase (PrmA)